MTVEEVLWHGLGVTAAVLLLIRGLQWGRMQLRRRRRPWRQR